MEFKLNKIDTDIRRKIKESTKDGKINKFDKVTLNPEANEDLKEKPKKNCKELHRDKKECIIVNGVKYGNEIEIKAELKENSGQGVFIDVKK